MTKLTWISGSLCTSTYFAGCLATVEGSELVPAAVCICACVHGCMCVCVCVCVCAVAMESIKLSRLKSQIRKLLSF